MDKLATKDLLWWITIPDFIKQYNDYVNLFGKDKILLWEELSKEIQERILKAFKRSFNFEDQLESTFTIMWAADLVSKEGKE